MCVAQIGGNADHRLVHNLDRVCKGNKEFTAGGITHLHIVAAHFQRSCPVQAGSDLLVAVEVVTVIIGILEQPLIAGVTALMIGAVDVDLIARTAGSINNAVLDHLHGQLVGGVVIQNRTDRIIDSRIVGLLPIALNGAVISQAIPLPISTNKGLTSGHANMSITTIKISAIVIFNNFNQSIPSSSVVV